MRVYSDTELEQLPDGTIIEWRRIPDDPTSVAVAYVRREALSPEDGRPFETIAWVSPGGWQPMSIDEAGINYPVRVVEVPAGAALPSALVWRVSDGDGLSMTDYMNAAAERQRKRAEAALTAEGIEIYDSVGTENVSAAIQRKHDETAARDRDDPPLDESDPDAVITEPPETVSDTEYLAAFREWQSTCEHGGTWAREKALECAVTAATALIPMAAATSTVTVPHGAVLIVREIATAFEEWLLRDHGDEDPPVDYDDLVADAETIARVSGEDEADGHPSVPVTPPGFDECKIIETAVAAIPGLTEEERATLVDTLIRRRKTDPSR